MPGASQGQVAAALPRPLARPTSDLPRAPGVTVPSKSPRHLSSQSKVGKSEPRRRERDGFCRLWRGSGAGGGLHPASRALSRVPSPWWGRVPQPRSASRPLPVWGSAASQKRICKDLGVAGKEAWMLPPHLRSRKENDINPQPFRLAGRGGARSTSTRVSDDTGGAGPSSKASTLGFLT